MGKCLGHPFLNFLDRPLISSYEWIIHHSNIYVEESFGVSIHVKRLRKTVCVVLFISFDFDFFTGAIIRNERLRDG